MAFQVDDKIEVANFTGLIWPYAGNSAPTGFLLCDGSSYSNNTYERLIKVVLGRYGLASGSDFTVDTSNDEIDDTSHGLSNGDILLMDSTGTLPGGLSTNTVYYVINKTTDTFQVSTSEGGSAVDITDTGSGTHTYYTKFNVPDMVGRVPAGSDSGNSRLGADGNVGNNAALGDTGGSESHQLTAGELASHTHNAYVDTNGNNSDTALAVASNNNSKYSSSNSNNRDWIDTAGNDKTHQNMPPYQTVTYIIKT